MLRLWEFGAPCQAVHKGLWKEKVDGKVLYLLLSLSSLVLLALFNNVLVKFCFSCPVGFQVAEQLNCL